MNRKINDIDELILDYLTFKLTDEGAEILREWLSRSEANRIYFRKNQSLWYGVHTCGNEPFNKQIAYKHCMARIKEDEKEELAERKTKKISWKVWGMIAAAFIGVFIGIQLLQHSEDSSYSVTVPLGSRSQITLPDKSLVWLNAGTTLDYTFDRRKRERRVKINGEAYFEVKKDKRAPFIVKTGHIDIQVLGTKFNVASYPEDNQINVALLEGSISLHRQDKSMSPIRMSPNEMAIYDKQEKNILISQTDASGSILWTKGILEFEDETFERIVQYLARKYNTKIIIEDDALARKRFYGTFDENESIYDILDKMTSNGNMAYEARKDKTIVIYSKSSE